MTTFTAWMSMPRVKRSAMARQLALCNRQHLLHRRKLQITVMTTQSLSRTPIMCGKTHTGADEVATVAVAKVMENAVPVVLHHLGVDVEAAEAELSNLLCQ